MGGGLSEAVFTAIAERDGIEERLVLAPNLRNTRSFQSIPPVPLLDSSDALDVVVAAPPRGPPTSSVAGMSGPPPVHGGPVLFHVGVAAAGPGVSI